MVSFQEVGRQWARMCKAFRPLPNGCSGCPLVEEHCYHDSPFMLDFDRIEYAVMRWAEENPEPVYPTWAEWLQSIGVLNAEQTIFHIGLTTQIYPDIAQKLGIKPKEGSVNE